MARPVEVADDRLKEIIALIEKKGTHADFPKKGIIFRDMFPVFTQPKLSSQLINLMCEKLSPLVTSDTVIVGLDARGFVLAPLVARQLSLPFVPLRKKGKLPGEVRRVAYALEYGDDSLEVQLASIKPGSKCIIIDDLLATGGSLEASTRLLALCQCQVTQIMTVMELTSLNGRAKLTNFPYVSLIKYEE